MKLPSEAECKRAVSILNDILPELFQYATRKRLTVEPFRQYDELQHVWSDYPDNWEDSVRGMLAGQAVCGRTKTCSGFVRSIRDKLPDRAVAIVREWRALPWIFCVFEIIEDLGASRLAVRPVGSRPSTWPEGAEWERLVVYSPSVAANYHDRVELFLAQLLPIDGVFHTYGVILPFRASTAEDLFAFADFLRAKRESVRGIVPPLAGVPEHAKELSDLIASEPLSFLQLFLVSERPSLVGRNGEWRKCASVRLFQGGEEMRAPAYWEEMLEKTGHSLHHADVEGDAAALYLDGGSPIYDPCVYLDFADRRVFLAALTEASYQAGREALAQAIDMPEPPQSRCSMLVFLQVDTIFGKVDELGLLRERFDEKGEDEAGIDPPELDGEASESGPAPDMDTVQRVMDRLMHNHNEGITESDRDVAEALGVEPELVEQLHSSLTSLTAGNDPESQAVDRLGLSPRAFHELTSHPVPRAEGALVLRSGEEIAAAGEETAARIEETPIVRLAVWLLSTVGGGERIPATQSGYLKPWIVDKALADGILLSPEEQARRILGSRPGEDTEKVARIADDLRPKKELDAWELLERRKLLETAGLLQLRGSAFEVTDLARDLTTEPEHRIDLYHHVLETMFVRHEWDEHPRLGRVPGLRQQAGLLFYAVASLSSDATEQGDRSVQGEESSAPENPQDGTRFAWVPMSQLTERFVAASGYKPTEKNVHPDAFGEMLDYLESVLESTFVSGFAEPFGLIETRRLSDDEDDGDPTTPRLYRPTTLEIRPTPLFDHVFRC